MKRSVAIVGPTPSFLRWAISYPCPLRELETRRLAESSFRQLRAIRELSLAQLERRCIDGVCIHPQSDSLNVSLALGFPTLEVASPLGGENFARACCTDCPANAAVNSQVGALAGCFGWLPTDLRFRSDDVSRGQSLAQDVQEVHSPHCRLIERVEIAATTLKLREEIDRAFPAASLVWYQLWRQTVPTPNQLNIIQRILEEVKNELEVIQASDCALDLCRFVDAIHKCLSSALELHIELVPAGTSDGLSWSRNAFCRECGFDDPEIESIVGCPMCGQQKIDKQRRRSKVLGIRPYIHLQRILGADDTRTLLQKFEQQG